MLDKTKYTAIPFVGEYKPRNGVSLWWSYKDKAGKAALFIERFDKEDGSKEVKPRCYAKNKETGKEEWLSANLFEETPLYNLENYKESSDKPVLIVEGEKTAEAAKRLFPDYWVTTWSGGCGQVNKVKIESLKGRSIYLLPDNDEPGRKAMQKMALRLQEQECKIHIVDIPEADFPKGWDVADSFPDDWNVDKLSEFLTKTPETEISLSADEKKQKQDTKTMSSSEKLQGKSCLFPEIIPYGKPVDGVALVEELKNTVTRYVKLQDGAELAIVYWILHTYKYQCFDITPRLVIVSPEKRCGKTTLLTVLSHLVKRPISASSITAASIFRLIEASSPTLLVDEADTFIKNNEELRGIMNAGHHCLGSVIRCVGKDLEARSFSAFAPCAIASIGKVPDTIMDRGIIINMRRLAANEHVEHFRHRMVAEDFNLLRRKCQRLMNDCEEKLRTICPDPVEHLLNRAFDNWECLFIIADAIHGKHNEEVRRLAIKMTKRSQGDDTSSQKTMLLQDIRQIFAEQKVEWVYSASLCNYLASLEERPWAEISRGSKITVNKLANMLKDFGIRTHQKNVNGMNNNCYLAADFIDCFNRYLPPLEEDKTL